MLDISRATRIPRKNSTIPASRVSPSMRRPSLVARVYTPDITTFNLRARAARVALFRASNFPSTPANPAHLYTDNPRERKGSLGLSLVLNDRSLPLRTCDRYCERPRGIREFTPETETFTLFTARRLSHVLRRCLRSCSQREDQPNGSISLFGPEKHHQQRVRFCSLVLRVCRIVILMPDLMRAL